MKIYASDDDKFYVEIYKQNNLAIWLDENGLERIWQYTEDGDTTIYTGVTHTIFYFNQLKFGYFDNARVIVSQDITPAIDCLLLEDGEYILLEDGGRILLE